MKLQLTAGVILFALCTETSAAQMAGTYYVGGSSPDFVTLQEAADSLMAQGVSGPVDVLVRPGEHTAPDSAERVLYIPVEIAGASSSSRVRFAPDRSAGGDNTNTFLRRYAGAGVEGYIIFLETHHVTVEGFTVELADAAAPELLIPSLAYVGGNSNVPTYSTDAGFNNLVVDCFFWRSTRGIVFTEIAGDVFITNNTVRNCVEPIWGQAVRPADRLRVTGNRMTGMRGHANTRPGDTGLHVRFRGGTDLVVSDNILDYTGGSGGNGLTIIGDAPISGVRVERNQVIGLTYGDSPFGRAGQLFQLTNGKAGVVANNFFSGSATQLNGAFLQQSDDDTLTFAHNTIRIGGTGSGALTVGPWTTGYNTFVRILNNVLISEGGGDGYYGHMYFDNLDHIELDGNAHTWGYGGYGTGFLDTSIDGRSTFASLIDLQNSGAAPHSVTLRPDFVDDNTDLHLSECSVIDANLQSVPVPGVGTDIDGETRDLIEPFIGADEPAGGPPPVFAGPTVFDAGTGSFLFAAGDIDLDGDTDFVVTNPGSAGGGVGDNDVTILWNDGAGTLSAPQHLAFGVDPNSIAVGLINADQQPDIVVQNDDGVMVRFGTGGGAFSAPVLVSNFGTSDLELADYDNDGDTDIFVLQSPSTDSARVVVSINEGDGTFVFNNFATVARYADDLEIADLDDDGFPDVLAVDATSTGQLFTLRNLGNQAVGVSRGFDKPIAHSLNVFSDPARSQFLAADFDGDMKIDVVLGASTPGDSLVLVRNDGSGGLGQRESFSAHRRGVPENATMLDYEGDGDLDLVVASSISTVDLLLNDGTGHFERVVLCNSGALSGYPLAISSGMLDDDASVDIGVLTFTGTEDGAVEILTNLEWKPDVTSIDDAIEDPQHDVALYQNYPNPFGSETAIRYRLPDNAPVRLVIYDLLGRAVADLVDKPQEPGYHVVTFNGTGLASGVYLYRISAGDFVAARTMVVVR